VRTLIIGFDRGVRAIVTCILICVAELPFSIPFLVWWHDTPEGPWLAAPLVLLALYIPFMGFIFPRILRFCWKREQIWTEPASTPSPAG
jgi:hypothetical protein